jgi:hypothetical protein
MLVAWTIAALASLAALFFILMWWFAADALHRVEAENEALHQALGKADHLRNPWRRGE